MTHAWECVAMSYAVQKNHNVLLWLTMTIQSNENEKPISVSHQIKLIMTLEL